MYLFDATPMAPIGTECLFHLKPLRRKTWNFRASDGWHVAPALKHHRVWQVVNKDTGAVRYTNTIKFKHHILTTPSMSAADRIVKATKHLQDVIQGRNDSPLDELKAIEALKALISGTPPAMYPQETERAPIGGEEALPTPPQRDHDVVIEAVPSHTREEEAHGQQYNIISQEEDDDDYLTPRDLSPDDELPPARYNLPSQTNNIMASVIARRKCQ